MSYGAHIRFGIPNLDRLIGGPSMSGLYGLNLGSSSNAVTMSIIGPDGSGKSLFGLHLASRYAGDLVNLGKRACILYVSTDLHYHMAFRGWRDFRLHNPDKRQIPFFRDLSTYRQRPRTTVNLDNCSHRELAKFLQRPHKKNASGSLSVAFIDLAAETLGDDWGFLNRVLAVLRRGPEDKNQPRHLVIVDAVEGFETLVGDKDAYGEPNPRRSRIAQLIRAAGKSTHLALIVEESRSGERWPEEFVSDLVIRLRCPVQGAYTRRTVEVVKTRGQGHVRGEHPLIIRDESPLSDRVPDPDDPATHNRYIHVFPSLNFLSRGFMKAEKRDSRQRPGGGFAAFGIEMLDDMLAQDHVTTGQALGFDVRGIPIGKVTSLIGDAGTKKSGLGDAFLSRAFVDYAQQLADAISVEWPEAAGSEEAWIESARTTVDKLFVEQRRDTAAVLITTNDITPKELARKFRPYWCTDDLLRGLELKYPLQEPKSPSQELKDSIQKLKDAFQKQVEAHVLTHMLCRLMEIHDLSTPALFHVVEQCVYGAYERLGFFGKLDEIPPELVGRVRFVIDDFSTIEDMYPDIEKDPIFLPYLFFFLERAGITTLVIETKPGQPDAAILESMDSMLRTLVKNHLHTWRVQFYGKSRVAIAAIPPFSGDLALVRELRVGQRKVGPAGDEGLEEILTVDPGFELYHGIEHGDPQPVPLEVRLYSEGEPFDIYFKNVNNLFNKVFTPARRSDADGDSGAVIKFCTEDYDGLRDLANLQRDVRLNHSLVFAVDEFWTPEGTDSIRNQVPYLTAKVTTDGKHVEVNDPVALFQATQAVPDPGVRHIERIRRFDLQGIRNDENVIEPDRPLARIPYTWDFGLLLGRRGAWMTAWRDLKEPVPENIRDGITGNPKWDEEAVGSLAKKVQDSLPHITHEGLSRRTGEIWSWREFLGVCRVVAEHDSRRHSRRSRAFDLTITIPSTMTCWILEIWASEIYARGKDGVSNLAKCFGEHLTNRGEVMLSDLADLYFKELAAALLLVGGVLDLSTVVDPDSFTLKCRPADPTSVATRHLYKSACAFQETYQHNESLVALRLPGHYSVRGDWFLAVANNSRSSRLADRALDLLSSRRANVERLQLGIGLPTRDLAPKVPGENHNAPVDYKLQARTKLRAPLGGTNAHILYGELLELGATDAKDDNFFWFWRGDLRDFDRQHRFFEKWIADMLVRLLNVQLGPNRPQLESLNAYDKFIADPPSGIGRHIFLETPQLREQLLAGLRHSSK